MGLCHGARVDIGDANTRGGYEPRPRPISVHFSFMHEGAPMGFVIQEGQYESLIGAGYVLSPCNPQYQQLTEKENRERLQSLMAHPEVDQWFAATCVGPGGHKESALFFPTRSMGEVAVMRLAVEYGQAEYIALLPPNFGGMQIVSVK